jgi:thiosulfate/3-mercaptopyruvate sulfurtransferase
MMSRAVILVAALLLAPAAIAQTVTPLVSPFWLTGNLNKDEVVVLDLQSPQGYQRAHIPGAVNTQYGNWRTDAKSPVSKVLPPVPKMEAMIGGLGIDNDTHVVIAPLGQGAGDLAMAARIYWSLKALGHDKVSILNGGLIAYAQARQKLDRTPVKPVPKVFKAAPRSDYLLGKAEVQAALQRGAQMVDNRSRAEYLGIYRGGGKARPGTIPGSVNLPYDWLTVNGSGQLHGTEDLRTLFESAGAALEGEQVNFCQSGNRAALAWFVAHELLGNDKAYLYDGSMAEWAVDPALPMESRIQLKCRAC